MAGSIRIFGTVSCFLFVCSAGCDRDSEQQSPVETEGQTAVPAVPADLPDGFPGDVHVYENAAVKRTTDMSRGFQVVLVTKDAIKKAAAVYRDRMDAAGWSLKEEKDTEGGCYLNFLKKGTRLTSISFQEMTAPGETMITIITPKGPE